MPATLQVPQGFEPDTIPEGFEPDSVPQGFEPDAPTTTATPTELKPESARNIPSITSTTKGGPPLQLPDAKVAMASAVDEIAEGYGEVLTHPSPIPTPFPEIGKDEHWAVAAGKEAVNLVVGVPQFFTTSLGIGAAAAGVLAPTVVAGAFTLDLLKSLGEQIHSSYKNWKGMSPAEKSVAVTDMVGTGAFVGLTGKHTATGTARFVESQIPRGTGISPELKATAPLTARAVEATIKPNEPANETKAPATVSEVTTPAAPAEAKVEAPRPADVRNEVLTPEQTIADQVNATVTVQKGQVPGQADVWDFRFKEPELEVYSFAVKGGATLEEVQAARERKLAELKPSSEKSAQSKAEPSAAAGAELTPVSEGTQPAAKPVGGELAQPELVGMGGAVPGEFEKDFRTGTGIKKAAIAESRAERGTEPADIENKGQVADDVHAQVLKKLDEDPAWPDRLVAELSAKPRALNPDEVFALDTRYIDLQNEYRKAVDEAIQAEADGRADGVLEGKRKADYWEQKLNEFEKMTRDTGTLWSDVGRMMQRTMKADFSLEAMERRARAAKNFKPLTPEEHARVKAFNEELAAKVKALEERQKAVVDEAVKDALDRVERESKTDQPAYHPRVLKLADRFATYMDKQAGDALSRIKEKMGRTSAGVDPTMLADLAVVGAAKLTRGVVELAKWSDAMIRDVGDWIKPHIAEIRKAAEAKFESETTALDKKHGAVMGERVRTAVKKTPTDAKADITEKITAKVEKGEIGDLTPFVNKLARSFIESGVKEREALIDAVHDVLKDILPDHTRRGTMDAISGYGKFSRLTKDDISVTLRDLKGQMQQVAKLEDMAAGEAPLKTGIERRNPSDAERQLISLVNEAKKKGGYEVTNPELQLASSLSTRLTAIRNRITDLTDEIAKGERSIPERKTPPTSPEIEKARTELAKLREEHAKVFNLALEKLKAGIKKRIATLETRMANKDFAPKPKRTPPDLDSEALTLKSQIEAVQDRYNEMLHNWKMGQLTTGQKIWRGIQKTRGAVVNIASSFDFSAPRQALATILANVTRLVTSPASGVRLLAEPAVDMFKAWSSESRARVIEQRIKTRPNAVNGADRIAGIEYTDLHTKKFTKGEENAHSILDEWAALPFKTGNLGKTTATAPVKLGSRGVRMSNRAFITFLNQSRAGLFDELLRVNFKDRAPTDLELKLIGNMVNIATGRGKINPKTAQVASEILWAPKLLASRVQLLTGQPLWTGKFAGSGRARMIIAKEMARIIAGGALLWWVSRMFDDKDETNAVSSDFGKIVRDKTRIDPWGGLQQVTTLAARTVTGKTESLEGKTRSADLGSLLQNFTRSKLRPDIGAVWNAYEITFHKVKPGHPETFGELASETVTPLPLRDIVVIMKEHGFTEGMIIEAMGQFGAGVSHYEEREAQK